MNSEESDRLPLDEKLINDKIRRRNFISFTAFGVFNIAGFGLWRWLANSPLEQKTSTAGAKLPLRKALNRTELFFRNFFSNNHLVKTYTKDRAAKKVRQNGYIGIKKPVTLFDYKLSILLPDGEMNISIEDLKKLPKQEIIFDFKCVEGWDQISHWGGVRFIDLITYLKLDSYTKLKYVGMETPDKQYYVGLDMESALHPQTLLAYEMNNKPLKSEYGAPLRLIIPVKYGIKNLKRIASISFSNDRPKDYWAERGYDYYSGL